MKKSIDGYYFKVFTYLLFFYSSFFLLSPKKPLPPTPFHHKIRSPLIQERHTIEWKPGQTTSFCLCFAKA